MSIRTFLPREHGLWAWVCVPLGAAVALAPGWPSLLGAATVLMGFLGVNAVRRGVHPAGFAALAGAVLVGMLTMSVAPRPWPLGLVAMVAALLALAGRTRRVEAEVVAITALAAIGGLVAASAGADAGAAAVVSSVMATWHTAGLWWVRGTLARVLPGRDAWRSGGMVTVAFGVFTLALGIATGLWLAAAVPTLYAVRARAHAPPTRPLDARRVGLTELAWSVAAAALAVAIV